MPDLPAAVSRLRSEFDRPALLPVFGAFSLLGLIYGFWQVLLSDLQQALRLSDGALGVALTTGFLFSFPAMVAGGRAADRWGARAVITATGLLLAAAFIGLTRVDRYWHLFVVMPVYYCAAGTYDMGINAAAIEFEQVTRRRIMAFFHAAFSGVAGLAALGSGLLLWAGVPFRAQYLLAAAALALGVGAIWRAGRLVAGGTTGRPLETGRPAPFRFTPAAMLLAGVGVLSLLSESTLETWSAIYLRSSLGLPAVLGAAGPGAFHLAMLAGRLGTGRLVGRLGRTRLLRLAGAVAAGGMSLALATTFPPLILAGLLLVGLALSGVVPTVFSLAGDLTPARAGTASSFIATLSYGGVLIGPIVIGGLADAASLRVALAVLIVAGLLIAALSTGIRERRSQAD